MNLNLPALFGIILTSTLGVGTAQQPASLASGNPLVGFSRAIRSLTDRASPAVVEVQVASYGPVEDEPGQTSHLIAQQRATASGVIVDPTGFIVTNAHVV